MRGNRESSTLSGERTQGTVFMSSAVAVMSGIPENATSALTMDDNALQRR